MSVFGLTLNLKDDAETIERYKEYHRAVWPEVEAALRGIGVTEMRIFLHGRRLFMYMEAVEGFDVERDFPRYAETARAKEWDALMRAYQEPVPGAADGEWWAGMEQVYDLSP